MLTLQNNNGLQLAMSYLATSGIDTLQFLYTQNMDNINGW